MKKYVILLMLVLALPFLTPDPASAAQAFNGQETSAFTDLYGQRRTREMIVISPDDAVSHSFYGLKIGDKKSDVIKTLGPAFTLMYELTAIDKAYLLTDTVYPDYYLTVSFDDQDRVSMIVYQENKKFHIMADGVNA